MKVSFGKRGVFFRQRSVAENVRKVTPKKECRREMLFWVKKYANNICQRRCYETPLQNHEPVNSRKVIRGRQCKGGGVPGHGGKGEG